MGSESLRESAQHPQSLMDFKKPIAEVRKFVVRITSVVICLKVCGVLSSKPRHLTADVTRTPTLVHISGWGSVIELKIFT